MKNEQEIPMKISHKANYGASREMWTRLATKPMEIKEINAIMEKKYQTPAV